MASPNKHAFGLSGSSAYTLADPNSVDFLAIADGQESSAVVIGVSGAQDSVHHRAREALNSVW